MTYSNDETDKAVRQKDYILTVFLLPIAAILVISGLFYLASHQLNMAYFDSVFGYYFAFLAGSLIYGFNKRYWLKMPDGTFHNMRGITPTNKIS